MKLSVIIPSYKDPLLQKTIDSLLSNCEEEIEIIPVLDGYRQDIRKDPRVKVIQYDDNRGIRGATNAGLEIARGNFVAKIDSHCLIAQGFDKIMVENCAEDWLLIPRRYSLDEVDWKRKDKRPICDYHYLSFPRDLKKYGYGMSAQPDFHKSYDLRKHLMIDDTMTMQGSCWLANRKYFMKHIGFLDDRKETYGLFGGEYIEIGLKYWLGGGAMKINKKTWYAHLFKRRYHYDSKMYERDYKRDTATNRTWSSKHWINNKEPNMIHPFSWLIEKFWPIHTWSDDWQKVWDEYKL